MQAQVHTEAVEQKLVAEVLGRVQGVGYRYFVRTAATRLGVTGWVMNAKDGSVRVEAEGSALHLNQLVEALRHVGEIDVLREAFGDRFTLIAVECAPRTIARRLIARRRPDESPDAPQSESTSDAEPTSDGSA